MNTLDYGFLPIAKSDEFLFETVIDTIQSCTGNFFEVRRSFSNQYVLYEV